VRQWMQARAWDLATLVITPVEAVSVDVAWLLFVAIVHYGRLHKWARKYIVAAYAWVVTNEVE